MPMRTIWIRCEIEPKFKGKSRKNVCVCVCGENAGITKQESPSSTDDSIISRQNHSNFSLSISFFGPTASISIHLWSQWKRKTKRNRKSGTTSKFLFIHWYDINTKTKWIQFSLAELHGSRSPIFDAIIWLCVFYRCCWCFCLLFSEFWCWCCFISNERFLPLGWLFFFHDCAVLCCFFFSRR